MKNYDYSSEICNYCPCTDFGFAAVGTGPHNLCYGAKCEEAYENWKENNPEDCREFEELF